MRLPARLLRRSLDSHKGDFGHILIIAGSPGYSGAAVLCAEAAMRTGAGLVTLGIPAGLNNAIIKIKPKEVMTLPLPETRGGALSSSGYKKIEAFLGKIDILVIGPGLGLDNSTAKLARKIIKNTDKITVIDADGLGALVGNLDVLKPGTRGWVVSRILTPHPGEMARLLGVGIDTVQSNREEAAKKFAGAYKITVVLKGHTTVVADYHGNVYINKTGNPGMATAGSGDVLTGMIAALRAQGLDDFEAAKYAVYVHGLAGDIAAKEKTQISLIASDIIGKIPNAIKRCS
jgi:NAD(P)H-hydrate epimerase